MAQPHDNTGLLDILQRLYHQLAHLITALRLRAYRPTASGTASAKLVAQLHGYIIQSSPLEPVNSSAVVQDDKPPAETRKEPARSRNGLTAPAEPNSLSQAFSKRHPAGALQNTVADKLMQSAWDHLHASIRYARAGDSDTARLHASIMENALKETAHYLKDNEYRCFIDQITEEFYGMM
ncbi:MAG: hypothetical protein IME93_04195 [Proteobacteria bacterium]|nr:hypothetical protein [Pseudomonadota bacterium]